MNFDTWLSFVIYTTEEILLDCGWMYRLNDRLRMYVVASLDRVVLSPDYCGYSRYHLALQRVRIASSIVVMCAMIGGCLL